MINKMKAYFNKMTLSQLAVNCGVGQIAVGVVCAIYSPIPLVVVSITSPMFLCTAIILKGMNK